MTSPDGSAPPASETGPGSPGAERGLARLWRAGWRALTFGADGVAVAVHGIALFAAFSPRFQWVVGLVTVALLALRDRGRPLLAGSRPLRVAARVALAAYVAAFWRGYAYVVSPGEAWAVAGLASAALVVGRPGPLPRWFVVPVAVAVGVLGRGAPAAVATKLIGAGVVVAADALLAPRGFFARLGREVVASFIALFATMVLAASFYYRPDTTRLAEIGAQPGVRLVVPRGSGPLTAGAQVYAAVPSCDGRHVVVVIHKSPQGYHLLDRATGQLAPIGTIRDPSDDVLFRCEAGELVLGDWRRGQGLVARAAALPALDVIRVLENLVMGPGPLIESTDGELIWHLDARDMKMRVAESRSGALVAETPRFAFGLAALAESRAISASPGELVEWQVERASDDARDRSCVECTGRVVAKSVTALDGGWLAPARWLTPNAWLHYTVAGADRVFVSSLQEGRVEAFERGGDALAPLASATLPGGARHLTYAPRHDLVLVSGWAGGVVTILAGRDLAVLRTLRVGARPRTVSLAADESTALVGTGAGIVEIDLASVRDARAAR